MNDSRIHLRLALAAAAALALETSTQAQSFVYSGGHGDIGLAFDAGALELHGHLHAGAVVDGVALAAEVEYEPSNFTIFVPDPSFSRPSGAVWDFTGTASGSPLWFLPQTQDAAKPFLGFGSSDLVPSEWSGSLRIQLSGVSGPGQFSAWQNGTFGEPTVRMSTADGISDADHFFLTPGGHAHYNLGFTAPGFYQVTLTATGVHTGDGAVSDTGTFVFAVQAVPEPSEYVLIAGIAGAAFAVYRRRKTA
jgi:surface-anchored protein